MLRVVEKYNNIGRMYRLSKGHLLACVVNVDIRYIHEACYLDNFVEYGKRISTVCMVLGAYTFQHKIYEPTHTWFRENKHDKAPIITMRDLYHKVEIPKDNNVGKLVLENLRHYSFLDNIQILAGKEVLSMSQRIAKLGNPNISLRMKNQENAEEVRALQLGIVSELSNGCIDVLAHEVCSSKIYRILELLSE